MQHPQYLGATCDLEALIRTHLFVIGPNNSGSTLLRRSFEISPSVWALKHEGQHVLGFAGPHTADSGDALIWNSTPERRARYLAPGAIDWERSKRAWYFQAFSRAADASVFVTSAPPFLLNLPALKANFHNARFLLLVRNPFAIAQGVLRRPKAYRLAPDEDVVETVGHHIGACFEQQVRNAEAFADDAMCLTYEQMCDDPETSVNRIARFVPEVEDYTLDQEISVKNRDPEKPRNMNEETIARLSDAQIEKLTSVFQTYRPALAAWGYDPGP